MPTVTIEEAQNKLIELSHRLAQGEEVVITENDQPVARLVPTAPAPAKNRRRFGTSCHQTGHPVRLAESRTARRSSISHSFAVVDV
jgi:antitoxin (DNA-binding transcriptional repressor) of toxin-antitoxin stability system